MSFWPFQTGEFIILLLLILVLLGPSKLPQLARGLGEAIREFRAALRQASLQEQKPLSPPSKVNGIDPELLKRIALKLGIDPTKYDERELIREIVSRAREKGLID